MKNILLVSCLLLAQPVSSQTANPHNPDVQLLESAGVRVDAAALLEYFRPDTDPAKLARLIDLLGDASFSVRDEAQKELPRFGCFALPGLKRAESHKEPEIAARAVRIRHVILEQRTPMMQEAAVRLLGSLRPPGTAEVLLAFLPRVNDADLEREICSAITAAALRDGKVDPALVQSLRDPAPITRCLAAQILLRIEARDHLPFIRGMLQDADPQVRLRIGTALAVAGEPEALPVLIDLLCVLEPDQLWPVKAVLTQLTEGRSPEVCMSDNAESRTRGREEWHAWLSKNSGTVDLARLRQSGIDPVTIGAYLKSGAEFGPWPTSADHPGRPRDPGDPVDDLPGFRFRFKRLPEARLPNVGVPFGLDLTSADLHEDGLSELAHLRNLATLSLGPASRALAVEKLKALTQLPNLTTLDVARSTFWSGSVEVLAQIPNLKTLYLPNGVRDAELNKLAPLHKTLTSLHLGSYTTGAGLKALSPLVNLTTLDLSKCELVTPDSLKELAPLQKLTTLHLPYVNDDSLHLLGKMGLLHALSLATTAEGTRPTSLAEVAALNLRGTAVTDAGLRELAGLTNLTSLDLSRTCAHVTDAGLKHLAPLRNLTHLDLFRTSVTDAGLADLAVLENLAYLNLGGTNVTGSTLKDLAGLQCLMGLDLSYVNLTHEGLKDLAALKNLTTLSLRPEDRDKAITDDGLKYLAGLTNLTALDLYETRITDAGMTHLTALVNLTTLELRQTRVTGVGLCQLRPLTRLTRIGIPREQISDDLLCMLRDMNLLHSLWQDDPLPASADEVTRLWLRYTRVTDAGLRELAPLKNVTYVQLREITDATLRELHAIGLLHALDMVNPRESLRPRCADEVTTIDLSGTRVTDAGLKELADFRNLRHLDLSETQVTDAGLRELAGFHKLEYLNLRSTKVTGMDLSPLTGLKNLAELNLVGCNVFAESLRPLAGLKKLNWLNVPMTDEILLVLADIGLLHAHTCARVDNWVRPRSADEVLQFDLRYASISPAALKGLASMKNLRDIHVKTVTDDVLRELDAIGLLHALDLTRGAERERPNSADQVTGINLEDTAVSDVGLKYLARFKNLDGLDLNGAKVTDAGLKELASLKSIWRLNLSNTKVTDAGLKELASLENLCYLNLRHTNVTDAGLTQLASCKNLARLDVDTTDAVLRAMNSMGLAHTLCIATAPSTGAFPSSADEVVAVDLHSTRVTDAGLKELSVFKNLTILHLPDNITAAGLKHLAGCKKLTTLVLAPTTGHMHALREIGMLHALAITQGASGGRPASAADVVEVNFCKSRVTDEGLIDLIAFQNLTTLNLSETAVTDVGLKHLAGCVNLKRLDLSDTFVTDAGLRNLAGCTSLNHLSVRIGDGTLQVLRELGMLHVLPRALASHNDRRADNDQDVVILDLRKTNVTDAGLKELVHLRNLRQLSLPAVTDDTLRELRDIGLLHALDIFSASNYPERPTSADAVVEVNLHSTAVTDAGLKELAVFKNLSHVHVGYARITDAGLKELAGCPKIAYLYLYYSKVTDAGLKELAPLKNLNELRLSGVTDATLRELNSMGLLHALDCAHGKERWKRPRSAAEVTSLDLRRAKITDACLKDLAALSNLAALDLRDTPITAAGVAALRKKLPSCDIIR